MRKHIHQKWFRDNQTSLGWLWIVGILVLLGQVAWGQTRTLTEHGYRIEHFTEKDGTPDHIIGGFAQSKDGYLWIITTNKLFRYDGYQFKEIEIDSSLLTQTIQDEMYFISLDSKENIWISTHRGIIKYNPKTEVSQIFYSCLLYTSPSPRDLSTSRMPSSA